MKVTARFTTVISLFIAAFIMQWGCAHGPKHQPILSGETRLELGTIGVVSAPFAMNFSTIGLPKGGEEAIKAGARKGADMLLSADAMEATKAVAGKGVDVLSSVAKAVARKGDDTPGDGMGIGNPVGLLVYFATLPVTVPVSMMVGAIIGAGRSVPLENATEAHAVLKNAFAELINPNLMRNFILEEGLDQTDYKFALPERIPTASDGEEVNYLSLENEGINTVLEFRELEIRLWISEDAINPSIPLEMDVYVKLIRAKDNSVLFKGLTSCPHLWFLLRYWTFLLHLTESLPLDVHFPMLIMLPNFLCPVLLFIVRRGHKELIHHLPSSLYFSSLTVSTLPRAFSQQVQSCLLIRLFLSATLRPTPIQFPFVR